MADSVSFEFIKEWAVRYVRHRDIAARKISVIRGTDYGFQVINKDGTLIECVMQLALKKISGQFIAATKNALVITLSNTENIQAVYGMWDALAANSGLLLACCFCQSFFGFGRQVGSEASPPQQGLRQEFAAAGAEGYGRAR